MADKQTEPTGRKPEKDRGLVAAAARLAGRAEREPDPADRRRRGNGPKPAHNPPLFDGYVRKSPVQSVREMPGYRRQKVMRAVQIALGLAVLLILLWLVLQSGLLAF